MSKIGKVIVYRGEDRELLLTVTEAVNVEGSDKVFLRPVDLGAPDEVVCSFQSANGGLISKTMTGLGISIVSAPRGELKVSLSDTDTAALKVGPNQSFIVSYDMAGITRKVEFTRALTVV